MAGGLRQPRRSLDVGEAGRDADGWPGAESPRRRWLRQAWSAGCGLALAGCALADHRPGASSGDASPGTGAPLPAAPGRESADPAVDAQLAPHQFSLDLGFVQDGDLHAYVERVGRDLQAAANSQAQPCTVRVVNAHHVNSYSFPGGSIGITRGWLVMLRDESELAAVLAHQLGHLGSQQVAQALSRSEWRRRLLASTVSVSQDSAWTPVIGLVDPLGDSPLLRNFTLEQEIAADALAMRYLARAGYPPQAWPRLLDRLAERARAQPGLLATLNRHHPLNDARRRRAHEGASQLHDATTRRRTDPALWSAQLAWLQRQVPAVEACQLGELAMLGQDPGTALTHFGQALQVAGDDYATRVRLAQCLQAQGRSGEALLHAQVARELHPGEAQAHRLVATLQLSLRDAAKAWLALEQYDRLLPGDPGVIFLQGVALEALGRTRHAAEHYRTYLRLTHEGQAAQYALSRLKALGYPP